MSDYQDLHSILNDSNAATNICVPSIILTLLRGSHRTKIGSLFPALFGTTCETLAPDAG